LHAADQHWSTAELVAKNPMHHGHFECVSGHGLLTHQVQQSVLGLDLVGQSLLVRTDLSVELVVGDSGRSRRHGHHLDLI
jgi:hypothetical protein